ncbi:hypothetical protein EWM64_g8674 [Hericium alpestre]|uniref:PX domain-containing protein n=1 Tax=Hericium alpestre TaxID=135208 RepID=A0A4Y9ZNC1_9AGAM|nr:hypothetical protein EWM64_g8674 [Hericium alpestre]
MHDFVAERADELDAKAGDSISVVAQSNREWFVAKPIGKLGKPGLIPVSFVEIRDPATNKRIENLDALMDNGSLPRVEEWKKQMLSYKASSIPLGTLDSSPNTSPVADSTFSPKTQSIPLTPAGAARPPTISVQQPADPSPFLAQSATPRPSTLRISRLVPLRDDEYWFRIHAMYQPYDLNDTTSLPPARDLVLFRAYNDFFDYQSSVIELFPREAGRQEPYPRIIPYMPGPADTVDDKLTAARREELDDYLRHLTRLNRTTGRYILEAELTRQFLST